MSFVTIRVLCKAMHYFQVDRVVQEMQQKVYLTDFESDDNKSEKEGELEGGSLSSYGYENLGSLDDIESVLRSQYLSEFGRSIPWKKLKKSK